MTESRLPGFYKYSLAERRRIVAQTRGEDLAAFERVLEEGGLSTERADSIVENVIGTYRLPFGLGLNFQVNGQDHLVPMVVEEPSVIAAASNAAKMIRDGGGFIARMNESLLAAQLELRDVPDASFAKGRIEQEAPALLERARLALPGLVRRGVGPHSIEVRQLAPDHLVVHLLVDCGDAMGANLVNSAAEALSVNLVALTGARQGLRILSNLADRRLVEVRALAPFQALSSGLDLGGADIAQNIEEASIFAERDPYRAATHNKGIMNGTDSVVLATGNDYRAVEAGAHAYAARSGTYRPLAIWRKSAVGIEGTLCMPLALGTVGGTVKVHEGAQLALRLAGVTGARELAFLCGAAGLASNLAALRALATEGIQRGHMSLHGRSIATSVGATGAEVDHVAEELSRRGRVNQAEALAVLTALRQGKSHP